MVQDLRSRYEPACSSACRRANISRSPGRHEREALTAKFNDWEIIVIENDDSRVRNHAAKERDFYIVANLGASRALDRQ
jgi:hypothetical protein